MIVDSRRAAEDGGITTSSMDLVLAPDDCRTLEQLGHGVGAVHGLSRSWKPVTSFVLHCRDVTRRMSATGGWTRANWVPKIKKSIK